MNNLFSEPIWSRQAGMWSPDWGINISVMTPRVQTLTTHSQYSSRPGTKGKVTGQTCPNYAQTETDCEFRTNKQRTPHLLTSSPPYNSLSTEICVKTEEKQIWFAVLIWSERCGGGGGSWRSGGLGQVNCCISPLSPGLTGCVGLQYPARINLTRTALSWHTNCESCELCWFITCFSEIIMSTISHHHHHNHPLYL